MKTAAVTGATSGIGFAVCRALARSGFGVIGIGHSPENCQRALDNLKEEFPDTPVLFLCGDLMQQREVVRLASELNEYVDNFCGGHLYALINNAGCVRSWYSTTEEGYEQQFALNHLAAFHLTYFLLPALLRGTAEGGGRVLITSSGSHKGMKMHWDDPMMARRYNPLLAYKQSKLCNMLLAQALNDRFGCLGLRAYGVDPGLVRTDIGLKQTGTLVSLIWSLRKKSGVDPEIPAQTYAFLCGQAEAPKGLYYYLCKEQDFSKEVNKENADRLFALSERLCGVEYGRYLKCMS